MEQKSLETQDHKGPMKVLLIGNTRIGDFILSSGLIGHLLDAYPDLRLTIACGYACEPLTRHIPSVERVIPMHKKPLNRHWLHLWHEVRGTHWDIIIDLRNSFVSRLVRKKKVYRLTRMTGKLHKVEEYGRLMGLSPAPSPKVWIGEEHRAFARAVIPDGLHVIGIGPGASHIFKRWPAENFAELCEKLIAADGLYPDAKIAVLGAPIELETAKPIFTRLPRDLLINLIRDTDLLKAAAILERCVLYIGNDNGQMHMAAAMGTNTIGLFGPTPPELYKPWGTHCSHVSSDIPQKDLADLEKRIGRDGQCLMTNLSVEKVIKLLS